MQLVLASTSAYRRALLERLGLPFTTARPEVDEQALPGESAAQTAVRLAAAKARAVSASWPAALIIGSDQVAELGSSTLGKPGNAERAIEQLQRMSGQTVLFHTAVAVYNSATGRMREACTLTTVRFRTLGAEEIRRYVAREQPYDCAGSAKVESLGISLLEAVESSDPTALIGLPLIAVCAMLRAEGMQLP